MASMLDWAIHYSKQNFSIIPVQGKKPLIQWREYQTRRADERQLREWWGQWPDADIGMVTGRISDRFVLDCDGDEGRRIVGDRKIDPTQCVCTRRGTQWHFKFPEGFDGKTTLAGILPQIDTRGEGGYVKLPPSLFSDNSGRYNWASEGDLAEPPSWLLGLLIENSKPKAIERENGESWLTDKLNSLTEGRRNDGFTSIAGSLRSRGYSASDIFAFLEPHAGRVNLPLSELEVICDSVGSYPTSIKNESAESFSSFLEHEEKVEWLVPGLIAKGSIGFVAGLPMTSKTWGLMDLAIEAAKGGGYWLSKFPIKAGKVLFIDQERAKSETQRRFKSLVAGKGLDAKRLNETLRIKCGSTTRLNLQQSFDSFRRELDEYRPDIVIVDSFVTFHCVPENDRTEIQKVLELIKQLRNEFGCAFLFINHESKMSMQHEPGQEKLPSIGDMIGSIAVPAAAELVLTVRRKDAETCVVYNTKNSLSQTIEPFMLSVTDLDEAKTKIQVRAH